MGGGLALLFCVFVYNVIFAGIPYPDPTPELSARYARHANIAAGFGWMGAVVFLSGAAAGLVRLIRREPVAPAISGAGQDGR